MAEGIELVGFIGGGKCLGGKLICQHYKSIEDLMKDKGSSTFLSFSKILD